MTISNDNFLVESYKRFIAKNPKYFDVIQAIAAIAVLILQAPKYLTLLGVTIPEVLADPYKTIVTIAGVVIALIAQLPNVDPPVIVIEPTEPVVIEDASKAAQ